MKVFIDTEFFEYSPLAVRDREFIDTPGANAVQLISIGAVRADGAEFYAENAEFSWEDVPEDHWIQSNVRPHLVNPYTVENLPDLASGGLHYLRGTPADIAQKFHEFAIGGPPDTNVPTIEGVVADLTYSQPEFWGYMCDYDWVVLCGLYGRMVDLPPEFPKFCLDLKQEMHRMNVSRHDLPAQPDDAHHALADARWIRDAYNFMPGDGLSYWGEDAMWP